MEARINGAVRNELGNKSLLLQLQLSIWTTDCLWAELSLLNVALDKAQLETLVAELGRNTGDG